MMTNDPTQMVTQLRLDMARELEGIKGDLYGDVSRGKMGALTKLDRLETIVIPLTVMVRWIIVILIVVLAFGVANSILLAMLFARGQ